MVNDSIARKQGIVVLLGSRLADLCTATDRWEHDQAHGPAEDGDMSVPIPDTPGNRRDLRGQSKQTSQAGTTWLAENRKGMRTSAAVTALST